MQFLHLKSSTDILSILFCISIVTIYTNVKSFVTKCQKYKAVSHIRNGEQKSFSVHMFSKEVQIPNFVVVFRLKYFWFSEMNMQQWQCYICGTETKFYGQSLKVMKTKHSESTIHDIIVKLANKNVELEACISKEVSDLLDSNGACCECLRQIDEYDLACTTAQQIEQQLYDKLWNTKIKLLNSQANPAKCNQLSTQYLENSTEDVAFDGSDNEHFDDNTFGWDADNVEDNSFDTISVKEEKTVLSESQEVTSVKNQGASIDHVNKAPRFKGSCSKPVLGVFKYNSCIEMSKNEALKFFLSLKI